VHPFLPRNNAAVKKKKHFLTFEPDHKINFKMYQQTLLILVQISLVIITVPVVLASTNLYLNEWSVKISGGKKSANSFALANGFVNLGKNCHKTSVFKQDLLEQIWIWIQMKWLIFIIRSLSGYFFNNLDFFHFFNNGKA